MGGRAFACTYAYRDRYRVNCNWSWWSAHDHDNNYARAHACILRARARMRMHLRIRVRIRICLIIIQASESQERASARASFGGLICIFIMHRYAHAHVQVCIRICVHVRAESARSSSRCYITSIAIVMISGMRAHLIRIHIYLSWSIEIGKCMRIYAWIHNARAHAYVQVCIRMNCILIYNFNAFDAHTSAHNYACACIYLCDCKMYAYTR